MSEEFDNGYHRMKLNGKDELKGIISILMQGKWLILTITIAFMIIGATVAFSFQPWWTSKAKITKPMISDYPVLYSNVKSLSPYFSTESRSGQMIVDKSLESIIDDELIFDMFLSNFDSNNNKQEFIRENSDFQSLFDGKEFDTENARDNFISSLLQLIKLEKLKYSDDIIVSIQLTSQNGAKDALESYINFVNKKVVTQILNNLQAIVGAKKDLILSKISLLEDELKFKIELEKKKTQMAIKIAEAANIQKPILTPNDSEKYFSIALGAEALNEKFKVLKSLDNHDLFSGDINYYKTQLKHLNSSVVNDLTLQSFNYLDQPSYPFGKDKPKRLFILIVSMIFGFVTGVVFVIFRKL